MFNNFNFIVPVIFIVLILFSLILLSLLSLLIFQRNVYKKQNELLSKNEKIFFDSLSKAITPAMYICPKVRIADLIEVNLSKNDRNFWSNFNRISQKHVDFVICDKTDFSPKLAIELDDRSHKITSRINRDLLVNRIFKEVNIPLIHIQAANYYDFQVLKENIYNILNSSS